MMIRRRNYVVNNFFKPKYLFPVRKEKPVELAKALEQNNQNIGADLWYFDLIHQRI